MRNLFYLFCTLAVLAIVFPGCGSEPPLTTEKNDKVVAPPLPSKPPLPSGKRAGVAPEA